MCKASFFLFVATRSVKGAPQSEQWVATGKRAQPPSKKTEGEEASSPDSDLIGR